MLPKLLAAFIGAILALIGQWGITSYQLHPRFAELGMPGFVASMFLGLEGHPGHSPMAPYAQFAINLLLYSLTAFATVVGFAKLSLRNQKELP
jgi:hypothetical protein